MIVMIECLKLKDFDSEIIYLISILVIIDIDGIINQEQ